MNVTKQAYRHARETLRGNGNYGMRWLPMDVRIVMSTLQRQKPDALAERAKEIEGCFSFRPPMKEIIRFNPI